MYVGSIARWDRTGPFSDCSQSDDSDDGDDGDDGDARRVHSHVNEQESPKAWQ